MSTQRIVVWFIVFIYLKRSFIMSYPQCRFSSMLFMIMWQTFIHLLFLFLILNICPLLSGLNYRRIQVLFALHYKCLCYNWWCFYGQFSKLPFPFPPTFIPSPAPTHSRTIFFGLLIYVIFYQNSPIFVLYGCYRLPAYWTLFCTTQ